MTARHARHGLRFALRFSLRLVSLSLLASAGCSTLPPAGGAAALLGENASAPAATGFVHVTLVTEDGKTRVARVPHRDGMLVSDALTQTKAMKQFYRSNVQVRRPLQDGNFVKMSVNYDRAKRRVEPSHDYALQAGDHVEVTEVSANLVDDLIGAVIGSSNTKTVIGEAVR